MYMELRPEGGARIHKLMCSAINRTSSKPVSRDEHSRSNSNDSEGSQGAVRRLAYLIMHLEDGSPLRQAPVCIISMGTSLYQDGACMKGMGLFQQWTGAAIAIVTFWRHCSHAQFSLPFYSSTAVLHFTIQNLAANTCKVQQGWCNTTEWRPEWFQQCCSSEDMGHRARSS